MSQSGVALARAQPVLELRAVSARAGDRWLVREVSLSLAAGESLALVGPSGAGKSSLAQLAMGLRSPSAGGVWVQGRELGSLTPREWRRQRRHMQLVFQDPQRSLDPALDVASAIAEGPELHAGRGELPWPPWGRRRRAWRRAQALEWLPQVGLDPSLAERFPAELSGGQRQRVAIARAMALHPQLLVADEPTAALDAAVGTQILDLLGRLQRQHGLACLLVSHNLMQAARFAQRIAVMEAGVLVEIGPSRQVVTAPRHAVTRQMLAALPPWPPSV